MQPFLKEHCTKCHGARKAKGGIRLDQIDRRIGEGYGYEAWSAVLAQLSEGKMPPEDSRQPNAEDRDAVRRWLGSQLMLAKQSDRVQQLRQRFSYGNHLSHERLFSGEVAAKGFSRPRLWRLNPHIYERTKKRILKGHWETLQRVRQPFALPNNGGFPDYAHGLFADSATMETLLRNARLLVDHQLTHEVAEPLRLLLEAEEVRPEQLNEAIQHQFLTMLYRPASAKEEERYREFFLAAIEKAGVSEGVRVGLQAIALSPEAVYRMEFGSGKPEVDGRRRLQGLELAFALSFAMTDDPPDDALIAAAESGMPDRKAVRDQVDRILGDSAIAKPKLLRFFREFFGYHRAPQVFKDAKRFRNYDWGIVPMQLVHEADLFVLHHLEQDKQVFKELLTSSRFFIGHAGPGTDPKELEERVVALQRLYTYWKDKPWKELKYELTPKVRADMEGLHPSFNKQPMKHRMSGGLIRDYMEYLKVVFPNNLRPMLAEFQVMAGLRERNLLAAHDQRHFLHAYNLAIDKFDCPTEQPFVLNANERVGLLTHPAWLIAYSKNTETNPITRGKWIRERLLAGSVPDIPITVDAVVPEDPSKTLRERFHPTTKEECWRCHRRMNPLGMTFENYDDFGRFRTLDEVSGKKINARGMLDSTGHQELDGEVANAVELVKRLAESERVRQSFVRHAFRYWMGRNEMLSDSSTMMEADRAYVESDGSFRALLISLLSSDSFLYRKGEPEQPLTTQAP